MNPAVAAAGWFLMGIFLGQTNTSESQAARAPLRLTFLNVGHGSCVLLEFPSGETWAYDAGNKSDGRGAAGILRPQTARAGGIAWPSPSTSAPS